jgi:hypothetical protein
MDIKQNWNPSIEIQIFYNSHTKFITYYCATAAIGTAAAAGGKLLCCSYLFVLRWRPFAIADFKSKLLLCNLKRTSTTALTTLSLDLSLKVGYVIVNWIQKFVKNQNWIQRMFNKHIYPHLINRDHSLPRLVNILVFVI